MHEKRRTEDPQTKRRAMFRWYRLYYLLAALNVITVAASLYLGHRTLSIYAESVTANRGWAERLIQFSQIAELVAGVNAPGNDVFTSLDAKAESARLDQAVAKYRQFVENIRSDIRSNSNTPAAPLLARLDHLNTAVNRIEDEAKQVFDFFSNGETDKAAKQMSMMDRQFGETASEITRLIQYVGSMQQKHFTRDMTRARQLEWFETVFVSCVLLIICGLTPYGHSLAKRMAAAETDLLKAMQAATDANKSKDSLLLQLFSGEKRLKSMLASSVDPLLTININGIVQTASDSVETVFGWTPQELIGQNVNLLMPEPYHSEHDGYLARYQRTGVSHLMGQHRELSALRRDGTVIPAVVTIWQVDLPNESEPLFMGIIRDITERKRSEAELKRFRAALDVSPDAVFLIDREKMLFVDMNETACTSMGYSREELLGMGPQDIKPELTEQQLAEKFDEIIGTEEQVGVLKTVHRHKDGSIFPVEEFLRALETDNGTIVIAANRDITERKRSEAELDSLNRQLINAARLAGKAEIATNVLHNVGNVLNSVNISAGVIEDKVRGSGIGRLTKAADIMEQHLDDLATYLTQDERGKELPRFLVILSRHIANENKLILEEFKSLINHIDHIKKIVAAQQTFARGISGVIEVVSLAELLEDAITINAASMKRHSVNIVRQCDDVAPCLVPKQAKIC